MPKKCRKKWRGGLKETIKLMLIRPPQLQFFEDGIKITATGYKIISGGKLKYNQYYGSLQTLNIKRLFPKIFVGVCFLQQKKYG